MFSQLPLNALRSFEAVARLGSYMAAAEELHVTPSAVSHQMRSLEGWMGSKLLERSGQGVRLLPQGELLASVLSGALQDVTSACRRAQAVRDGRQLVIAVIPSIATCWLIPNLAEFHKANPKVSTRVIYAIHGQPIDFSDVDVAIVYYKQPPRLAGTQMTKLLPGDSAPVCSPAFFELHGPFETPAAIAEAGLLHDTDMLGWRQWLSLAEAKPALPPEGPLFEDFNLLRAATLAGQGISLCPLSIIHDDLAAGRLIQLSGLTVLGQSGYYLAQSDRALRAARPEVSAFLAWVLALRDRQAAGA